MPNLVLTGSKVTEKGHTWSYVGGFPSRKGPIGFWLAYAMTRGIHDILNCPLFSQIEIAIAIRSFIKELHSAEGNKGDGGDHSSLQSLHGTVTGPLQNVPRGLLNSRQECFSEEANGAECSKD